MLEETTARKDDVVQIDEQQLIKDLGGMLYLAGSDTTVASVVSFFLAMAVYPDVQKKAQAELDRVVGFDRLPEFSDEQELPYICGVVNECFRWLPVLTMGTCITI
jgi:cytochrome P450